MLYELECVGWFIGVYSGAGTVTLLNAKTAVKDIYIYIFWHRYSIDTCRFINSGEGCVYNCIVTAATSAETKFGAVSAAASPCSHTLPS